MSLQTLKVEDVRCLHRAELELHPRHNLIWGPNGSGKTSLLEALYLLGRGRSFRTRNSERLIAHGERQLTVFGGTPGPVPQSLGIQVLKSGPTVARINGQNAASLTELAQVFPVQVIDPGVHKLLEEGGFRRRRWLDWSVFHVEPSFADSWLRYSKAVKQRNAALRHQPEHAGAWDAEVIRLGQILTEARLSLMQQLGPIWEPTVQSLSGLNVEMNYSRGWAQEVTLEQALRDSRTRDQARGLTHSGPHRADVVVRLAGRPAREVLSRGQQKLVAIAMILAQLKLLGRFTSVTPTLLLDDPAAELDESRLAGFIDEVNRLHCQLVLTSLQAHSDPFGAPGRVFHVEQGRVAPV